MVTFGPKMILMKSTFSSILVFELLECALRFEIFQKMAVILLYWFAVHLDAKKLAPFT